MGIVGQLPAALIIVTIVLFRYEKEKISSLSGQNNCRQNIDINNVFINRSEYKYANDQISNF